MHSVKYLLYRKQKLKIEPFGISLGSDGVCNSEAGNTAITTRTTNTTIVRGNITNKNTASRKSEHRTRAREFP